MLQHPYARSLQPVPDEDYGPSSMRRTTSARPTGRNDSLTQKRRPLPLPQLPRSASATDLALRPRAPPPPPPTPPVKDSAQSIKGPAPSVMGPAHRRHFVKQENAITLVLSGHSGAAETPVYTSGCVLRGLVTLARAESVTSVVVNLEGALRVRDLQGGGANVGSYAFLSETLYIWDGALALSARAPAEFNFATALPAFARAGERRLLPPSYDGRLGAIPGCGVQVQYAVVVSVVRHAGPIEFWKRRTRLRVPFVFQPLTRPPAPGPFPARTQRESAARPQTVFTDSIAPRHALPTRPQPPPIAVRLFLPHAQVLPAAERITFRLSLRAPAALLAPFASSPPSSPPVSPGFASFLPISPVRSVDSDSDVGLVTSAGSLRARVKRARTRPQRGAGIVGVRLERRTCVGARAAATDVLAAAALHRADDTDPDSGGAEGDVFVRWWGALDVPAGAGCAGFVAERLCVQDFVVVEIDVAGGSAHELPFRMEVPVRLTSHSARAVAAVKVGEPEVRL